MRSTFYTLISQVSLPFHTTKARRTSPFERGVLSGAMHARTSHDDAEPSKAWSVRTSHDDVTAHADWLEFTSALLLFILIPRGPCTLAKNPLFTTNIQDTFNAPLRFPSVTRIWNRSTSSPPVVPKSRDWHVRGTLSAPPDR